jgi:hypothetical protein
MTETSKYAHTCVGVSRHDLRGIWDRLRYVLTPDKSKPEASTPLSSHCRKSYSLSRAALAWPMEDELRRQRVVSEKSIGGNLNSFVWPSAKAGDGAMIKNSENVAAAIAPAALSFQPDDDDESRLRLIDDDVLRVVCCSVEKSDEDCCLVVPVALRLGI